MTLSAESRANAHGRVRFSLPLQSQARGFSQRLFLSLASRIRVGELSVTLPDGSERTFAGSEPGLKAVLVVRTPGAFRRILLGGRLAFAESYMDGDCDSPDLSALIELAIANEEVFLSAMDRLGWLRIAHRITHLRRPNSMRGARRNIAHHYDLGNAFYAHWLDSSMTYSSALYERQSDTLATGQANKYRRMAQIADIKPAHHVLEVGCGWGGFSIWAVREIGCRLTAITISREQYEFAARRIQTEGLAEKIDLRLQDYRDVDGAFDSIVSIEMLEAVGEKYWPRFFETLQHRLVPGGRAALQVITIDDAHFEAYRRGVDFIQRYIFPGGMLPASRGLREQSRDAGLLWRTTGSYGSHYSRTLAEWRKTFERAWPDITTLGFDERFRRMWRYYLTYCEAGFNAGRIDVIQAGLQKI